MANRLALLVAVTWVVGGVRAYAADGGCAQLSDPCSQTHCCAGLSCIGGEALAPTCRQPDLTDAGCLASGATCASIALEDGGSFEAACCGSNTCQRVGVAGTPSSCQPSGGVAGPHGCGCSTGGSVLGLALALIAGGLRRRHARGAT